MNETTITLLLDPKTGEPKEFRCNKESVGFKTIDGNVGGAPFRMWTGKAGGAYLRIVRPTPEATANVKRIAKMLSEGI